MTNHEICNILLSLERCVQYAKEEISRVEKDIELIKKEIEDHKDWGAIFNKDDEETLKKYEAEKIQKEQELKCAKEAYDSFCKVDMTVFGFKERRE